MNIGQKGAEQDSRPHAGSGKQRRGEGDPRGRPDGRCVGFFEGEGEGQSRRHVIDDGNGSDLQVPPRPVRQREPHDQRRIIAHITSLITAGHLQAANMGCVGRFCKSGETTWLAGRRVETIR